MHKNIRFLMIGLFFGFASFAYAEEEKPVKASEKKEEIVTPRNYNFFVESGIRITNGEHKSAGVSEYNDNESKGLLNFEADYYSPRGNHNKITGMNLLAKDMEIEYNGGSYNRYKYDFSYKEMVHNLSFNAKTFYTSGLGSETLSYAEANVEPTSTTYTPTIPTDTVSWHQFDYSVNRSTTGVKFGGDFEQPYFLELNAEAVKDNGIRPYSTASGVYKDILGVQSSPFGNAFEIPEPVDQETLNFGVTGGYRTKDYFVSIKTSFSRFDNKYDYLTFRNPYVTSEDFTERSALAPDNFFHSYQLSLAAFNLPVDSSFTGTLSRSILKANVPLLNQIASATNGTATTNPTYAATTLSLNTDVYKGDITYDNAAMSWTANPTKSLDTQLYFRYLVKRNNSNDVVFTNGASSVENEHFRYQKRNAGIDLGYKLPMKSKVSAGYDFLKVSRAERKDAVSTTDNKYFLGLKSSYFKKAALKTKFAYTDRNMVFGAGDAGSPGTVEYIRRFIRRFDSTDKKQYAISVGMDLNPIEDLDIGVELSRKRNDYSREGTIGLRMDTRDEIYVDMAYDIPEVVAFNFYLDLEKTKSYSNHRRFAAATVDPSTAPTTTAYNWSISDSVVNTLWGVTADIPVIEDTLDFTLGWNREKSDGKADFAAQNNIVSFEGNPDFGDYLKNSFFGKAKYILNDNFTLTFTYVYSEMDVIDMQFTNYQPVFSNTILGGAFNDTDYTVNLTYLTLAYNF